MALVVKKLLADAEDIRKAGSIPGLGRCPGRGHGNPLQYSCLENPVNEGGRQATAHRVTKRQTRLKRRSTHRDNGRDFRRWRVCCLASVSDSATP